MRRYLLLAFLLTAGYAFSQAAAEGALLNSTGAGATAGAARALSGNLNQALGRASGQVSGSQMIVVPPERRRTAARSTTPGKRVVANAGISTGTKPGSTPGAVAQAAAKPQTRKSWEVVIPKK